MLSVLSFYFFPLLLLLLLLLFNIPIISSYITFIHILHLI